MSDRLQQLLRQRALLQEQLAWIDSEIAAENRTNPPAPKVDALPIPTPAIASAENSRALADDLIARYKPDTVSVKEDVKKGCFLYFFLAFAVVGLGLIALYFYSTRK